MMVVVFNVEMQSQLTINFRKYGYEKHVEPGKLNVGKLKNMITIMKTEKS